MTKKDYQKKYWSNGVKLPSSQKRTKQKKKARLAKNWKEQKKKLNEMPAGDEKGLSKEILEQRRKIAEQSKKDKAEEKARLAKNGRSKRRS